MLPIRALPPAPCRPRPPWLRCRPVHASVPSRRCGPLHGRLAHRTIASDKSGTRSISTLLGREPSETYFIDRRWQVQRDPGSARGRNRQVIRAIAVFRGEECSWQSLMVTRRPGAGTLSEVVADGDEVRIPCPDLKAQP